MVAIFSEIDVFPNKERYGSRLPVRGQPPEGSRTYPHKETCMEQEQAEVRESLFMEQMFVLRIKRVPVIEEHHADSYT